jgi:hypothetical protein
MDTDRHPNIRIVRNTYGQVGALCSKLPVFQRFLNHVLSMRIGLFKIISEEFCSIDVRILSGFQSYSVAIGDDVLRTGHLVSVLIAVG